VDTVGDAIRESNMRLSGRLSDMSRPSDFSMSPTIEYKDPRLKFY